MDLSLIQFFLFTQVFLPLKSSKIETNFYLLLKAIFFLQLYSPARWTAL